MNELQRHKDQFHRALYGDAWHGESLLELLNGISAAKASVRPIPRAHTVWEIVLHITLWNDIVRGRIEGNAVEPGPGDDWRTAADVSDDAWMHALKELSRSFKELEDTLGEMTASEYLENLPGKDFDASFLIQGIIQHAAYNGGQIGIIRKAL